MKGKYYLYFLTGFSLLISYTFFIPACLLYSLENSHPHIWSPNLGSGLYVIQPIIQDWKHEAKFLHVMKKQNQPFVLYVC